MTLDGAVRVSEDILKHVEPGDPPEEHEAISLGIEAIKAWKSLRLKGYASPWELLPGETKEEE